MVGLGVHVAVLRRHSADEAKILNAAFALHLASGFGQVLLTQYYFGGGDMTGYFQTGVPMADAMRADFGTFFPAVVEGFFRVEELSAPVEFMAGGGSTQSMSAIAILLLFGLGNSLYAAVLTLSIGSYLSKVLLYEAIAQDFAPPLRRYALIGATLLPTAAFWSCGLLKEPVVMCMIGPAVLGLRWLSNGHRRGAAIVMVVGSAVVISVIKPYVLMALSIAAGLFYFWSRLFSNEAAALKPFALITAVAVGSGGFVLGNRFFTKAENDDASKSFSRQRQVGANVEGGSNFSIEGAPREGEEVVDRGFAGELALAPFALFTALFRPLIFEARNAVQLANALEATLLLVMFLQIVRERGLRGLFNAVRGSPTLLFCATFTLALALGTGLASTNMGTLSRYRAPMMPFFFVLLMVLRNEKAALRKAAIELKPGVELRSPAPQAAVRAEAQAPVP
ncbi:MAG: hypothetical protein Q8K32_05795 [Archangium sp.]|nr:hypothetical protein [Archangium sp.]